MKKDKESSISYGKEHIEEFSDRINYLCTEFSNAIKTNRKKFNTVDIFNLVIEDVDNNEQLTTPIAIFYNHEDKNTNEIVGTNNDYLIYYIRKGDYTSIICIQFMELSINENIKLSSYTINKLQRFYLVAKGEIDMECI